jgi:HEAT repeat protein
MMRHGKAQPNDPYVLRDETARPVDRASALSRLVSDRRTEFEPDIVRCLAHEHPVLRGDALMALVGRWRMERHVSHADRMLVEDPDEAVRGNAAWALSMYAARADRISEQERTRILRTLARVVLSDEDPGVQQSAYDGVLRILDRPFAEYMREARFFDPQRDVNWELLKPYLE